MIHLSPFAGKRTVTNALVLALAVMLVSSTFLYVIDSPIFVKAQSVLIETSADDNGGVFFGESLLQVVIEDDTANDDTAIEYITIQIEGIPDGGTSSTDVFVVSETSVSSGRFEFYLTHVDANFISADDIDPINSAGVEGASGVNSTIAAPIITFGAGGDLDIGADLYEDSRFIISFQDIERTIDYEETAASLSIDRSLYGADSVMYIRIDDQDGNLNPTQPDSFLVDGDTNILFTTTGAIFDANGTFFEETADNSAVFEAAVALSVEDTSVGPELIVSSESVLLTLHDMANYNDAGFDNIENDSVDTSDSSFSIDNVDGQIDPIGTVTFSSELKLTIRDNDQNKDSNHDETLFSKVIVRVVNNAGADIEVLDMAETDDNTGVFEIDLSNSELGVTFLDDGDLATPSNGILEFRADDLFSNIAVMYNDTLTDDENVGSMTLADVNDVDEVFIAVSPLTLSTGALTISPEIAPRTDDFDITLLDGDLNDDPRSVDTYEIMLFMHGGPDNAFDVARNGLLISEIANFEFSHDGVPMDFVPPFLNITLIESGINTGEFVGSDQLDDLLSTADITTGGGLLSIKYNDETSSPFIVSSDTLQVAPAIGLDSIVCWPDPSNPCVTPTEPRWEEDRISVRWTVYPDTPGIYHVIMNVTDPSNTITSYHFPQFSTATNDPIPVSFEGISFSKTSIGTNTIAGYFYDNSTGILLAQAETTVDVRRHPIDIFLNQPANVVAGTSLTLSGFFEDALTGEDLIGMPIEFTGDGALHIQDATTDSVTFSDPDDVRTSFCATCVSDSGMGLGNTLLQIDAGGEIDVPPTSGIVTLVIDGMGNKVFTLEVEEADGGGSFIEGATGSLTSVIIFHLSSPNYIDKIKVLSVDNKDDGSGGPLSIARITTLDPLGDPREQHDIDFEVLAVNPLGGPLVVNPGSFFSSGDSPSVTSEFGYSAQAQFVGDALYEPSNSDLLTFNVLDDTLGKLGEAGFSATLDSGRGTIAMDCSKDASGNVLDVDGDSICDDWELDGGGIPYSYTVGDQTFRGTYSLCFDPVAKIDCPNPERKDIYVEIDFMEFHRPLDGAISRVVEAFNNSPADPAPGGFVEGIALHIKIDDEIPHADSTHAWTDPVDNDNLLLDDFDDTKAVYFGTDADFAGDLTGLSAEAIVAREDAIIDAKAQIYHYGLFIHSIGDCGPSGLAEIGGNDFIVSLGCNFDGEVAGHTDPDPNDGLTYTVGTEDQQAGTLMHELGHNLNLHHGGPKTEAGAAVASNDFTVNCKPNYPSVMSYSRQTGSYFVTKGFDMVLDYSRQDLPTLIEDALNEEVGLPGDFAELIVYRTPTVTPKLRVDSTYARDGTFEKIEWDGNKDTTSTAVTMNINNFAISGCNSSPDVIETLEGHDDWHNLMFKFRKNPDYIDGIHENPTKLPEMTGEILEKIEEQALELDEIAPSGAVAINSGAEYSSSRTLQLGLECSDNSDIGCTDVRIAKDGTLDDELYEEFSPTKSLTFEQDGLVTVQVEFKDGAENVSPVAEDSIIIDTVLPVISTTQQGQTFEVGAPMAPEFTCADDLSGIVSCTSDVASLDTSIAGEKSYIITAIDSAGNTATLTVTYIVASAEEPELFCGLPIEEYDSVVDGTSGNDKLTGTDGNDLIRGYEGKDKISAKNGNDCVIGGEGDDKLFGGDGDDTIEGNAGNDWIFGNDGNDNLTGGAGKDKILGGQGNDKIEGNDDTDYIFGNDGNDDLSGGSGDDLVSGGKDDDIVDGGDGDDKLFGKDGNDSISGSNNNDKIHGGNGEDAIDGGEGNDTCYDKKNGIPIVNCESYPKQMKEDEDEDERED